MWDAGSLGGHGVHSMSQSIERGRIDLHVRDAAQLFDSLDPSPFGERDLDPKADAFIVESARELCSGRPREIALHLDQPTTAQDADRLLGEAIRTHFARRAELSRRELRRLLRRGLVSFAIGLLFLTALFVIVQATGLARAQSGFATLARESMIIVGWVAMWRPLDTLLYDWWPIVGDRRLFQRLSRIVVRTTQQGGSSAAPRREP